MLGPNRLHRAGILGLTVLDVLRFVQNHGVELDGSVFSDVTSQQRVTGHHEIRRGDAVLAMDDAEAMILERAPTCFAVMNAYPYTSGHVMVAPNRHVASITDLDADEAAALMHGVQRATAAVDVVYRPEGINVGMNIGRAAGAGVPGHVHVHVLPRWNGDTNFMTAIGNTRVLPEDLGESAKRLRPIFERLALGDE